MCWEKNSGPDKIRTPRFRPVAKKFLAKVAQQHDITFTTPKLHNGARKQSEKEAIRAGQGKGEETTKWPAKKYGHPHWRARGRRQREPARAGCEACHGARHSSTAEGMRYVSRTHGTLLTRSAGAKGQQAPRLHHHVRSSRRHTSPPLLAIRIWQHQPAPRSYTARTDSALPR